MGGLDILIAETSPVYRKLFEQAFRAAAKDARIEHVSSMQEMLEKISRLRYSVVLFEASVAEGEAAWLAREIRRALPDAAILLATLPSAKNDALFAAVKCGAIRLVKPVNNSYQENLDKITRTATRVMRDLTKHSAQMRTKDAQKCDDIGNGTADDAHSKTQREHAKNVRRIGSSPRFRPEIALIASSTGGPNALETVIGGLSAVFPVPVMVVQHMLPTFTKTLAENLDKQARLRVKVAEEGEAVAPGTVYIAPDGWHMTLNAQKRVALEDGPPVNGIRPTADALFESVARVYPAGGVLAVVLTGMGRDGERGLTRLKQNPDCFCIAQSRETCVVYGMPRAAVEAGLVDKIVDLMDIALEMESIFLQRVQKRDGR